MTGIDPPPPAAEQIQRARQSLLEQLRSDLLFGIEELPRAGGGPSAALPSQQQQSLVCAAPAVTAPAGEPARAQPAPGRAAAAPPGIVATLVPPLRTLLGAAEKRAALLQLAAEIAACARCRLHEQRTLTVPGEGNVDADLMFIGEGPGADEDRSGRPFVGRAGELLTRIIEAMGFARESVFIANVVKCRPPGNRTPDADEMVACLPFLRRQIGIIAPRVICALGKPAMQTLLQTTATISAMRGKLAWFDDIPVVPTFHPAYLLRNPEDKAKVWRDVQYVARLVVERGGTLPAKPAAGDGDG